MKKILLQSILIGAIFLGIILCAKVVYGVDDTGDSANIYIGEKAEDIDGMLHKVEYLYGSPIYKSGAEMLTALKKTVYPEDRISFFPNPNLNLGSRIIIKRATPILVLDSDDFTVYRTWKTNIKDFLLEKNIVIGEKDIISPKIDTKVSDLAYGQERNVVAREGRSEQEAVVGEIIITRVAETEIKNTEVINYETITKKDPNLEKGKTRIETEGKKGIKELTYLVRRENGKEISKNLIKTEITREPINKVIYEGTKVVVYGTGKATWYGLIGGMTAAHNSLPMGTMVHVVNLENGKSVDVKIVDRGIQGSAVIDLSDEAFQKIASLGQGVVSVRLEKL